MEQWKFIGNSQDYMISSLGNVKSFNIDKINGKIMKAKPNREGYIRIMISYPVARSRYLVHRLVAQAFIENPDEKCCINHIDNNPSNNNLNNLEWCTYSENLIHAEKQGRLASTHLKAGNETGKISKEKKINEINNFIKNETLFNDIKIIELSSVKFSNKKNTYTVKCKCKCNNIFETTMTNLTNNIIKRCTSCKSNNTKLKNYIEMKNSLENKNYKFVKVLNISEFNPDIEKSEYTILTECVNCKIKKEVNYKHLIRKQRFNECSNCGHK